jgi:hypothetical protein
MTHARGHGSPFTGVVTAVGICAVVVMIWLFS